jgi:hypothetical protein
MTNVICNHGTVQTRFDGIGSALRCVMGVVREQRLGVLKHASGKRLHSVHRLSAGGASASPPPSPSAGVSPTSAAVAWQRPRMPRPVDSVAVLAAAAEPDLPAAVWATLVVARAISA